MISWMQKHNKYLVWTIWVATIAFIGAGFVGWGSYDFGKKAGNVAKVGDIEIKQTKLNMVYSSIYNQYNQAMQGTLDDKKAQEMGLIKQAFARLATQAKVLNFAKDLGIIVSDAEVAQKLQTLRSFPTDGNINKEIYDGYLKSQRLRANAFEIYTDGSFSAKKGKGGFAVILKSVEGDYTLKTYETEEKSSSLIELLAAIKGLELTSTISKVRIITDSQYVRKGLTEWIVNWKRNNWLTASGTRVKNITYWTFN